MTAKELLDLSLGGLDDEAIDFLKSKIIGEYLDFYYADPSSVSREIFMEKLCDYLEKVELKTGDRVSVRGKGKFIFDGEGGTTRKDKLYVSIKRYI